MRSEVNHFQIDYKSKLIRDSEIWPTFHYLQSEPTDGRKERNWWKDYIRFNQAYADKILAIYQPGDIVWIHDYTLLLLPSLLRQKLPKIYVATFLHAPFPSSEFFRCMTSKSSNHKKWKVTLIK